MNNGGLDMTITRRRSNKQALLALLSDGTAHHQRECLHVAGFRYGARVFELRHDDGLNIETIRIGDDEFAYRLVAVEPRQMALI